MEGLALYKTKQSENRRCAKKIFFIHFSEQFMSFTDAAHKNTVIMTNFLKSALHSCFCEFNQHSFLEYYKRTNNTFCWDYLFMAKGEKDMRVLCIVTWTIVKCSQVKFVHLNQAVCRQLQPTALQLELLPLLLPTSTLHD